MAITSPPIKGNVLNVGSGMNTVTNITAATVVKAVAGRVARISVIVAGSAVGSVNNAITTGAAATSNQIFVIPDTVGSYIIDMWCTAGIVVVPGTGQTLAVSYT